MAAAIFCYICPDSLLLLILSIKYGAFHIHKHYIVFSIPVPSFLPTILQISLILTHYCFLCQLNYVQHAPEFYPVYKYLLLCRSLGRVGVGHMVYISALTCALSTTNMSGARSFMLTFIIYMLLCGQSSDCYLLVNSLEVSWHEKEPGSLFVNLSLLPALLNSACLHNLSPLSDLPHSTNRTHVSLLYYCCEVAFRAFQV